MNKQTFWESEVYTLRDQIQLIETERNNLERENASLRAVAMKLIVNNGGPLQLEEQVERDSVDDYIMIKLQDFEALCAAIAAARKEQLVSEKIKQMTDAASLDIGHSCLSGDKWMRDASYYGN
jgi:hypothetical protein